MFENLDEVVLALDNFNMEVRGAVVCDSTECEVACSASHCEAMFELYYKKFPSKRELGNSFKRLFKITNFLSSQIDELMEKKEIPDHDQTRQVAEEAARTIVTDALATIQNTLTQKIDAFTKNIDTFTKNIDEKISEITTAVEETRRVPVLGSDDPDQLNPEPVLEPESRYSVIVELPADKEGKTKPITQEGWKTVEPKLKKTLGGVRVNKTSHTNRERVSMTFPDKESKDQALAELTKEPDFKTTDTSKPEKRTILPKIKIVDIDEDMFADEGVDQNTDDRDLKRDECKRLFIEKMKNKNKHLEEMFQENETFEIVFMSKRDKLVVIKVSPIFRDFLRKHGDQVHLGLKMSQIHDHYSPTQCYHCQGFGHRVGSPRCPSKNEPPTCMYCSRKGHRSKKCYSKEDVRKRCCINCSSSSDPTLQNDARSHNSASDICPLMIRETKSLMNKTLATNESKNEYLRKMMMKKEQQRCFQRY